MDRRGVSTPIHFVASTNDDTPTRRTLRATGASIVIPLDTAREFVLSTLVPLSSVEVPLSRALGAVASSDVVAREAVPGFANSSMDGFAVRSIDTSTGSSRLRIVGTVLAGDASRPHLNSGEAIRIMTGAPIPAGADSVCKIEETVVTPDGAIVAIERVVPHGENVRHAGDDVARGQALIGSGDVLTAARLGILAGQGYETVAVHRRPRVGVLSTGDELAGSAGPLAHGQIRDTNRPALLALVQLSGFDALDLGTVADDETAIRLKVKDAVASCDAVVSTGGVSVGDVDYVKSVLGELYGERSRSMQVAIKPGKPFTFATAAAPPKPFFALAGNPVATLVGFELFVRPALRRLAGYRHLQRPTSLALLDCPLPRSRDGKIHLMHVTVAFGSDHRLHVKSAGRQGSHLLSAVTGANALAVVQDGDGLDVGDEVDVLILDLDALSLTP